MRVCILMGSPRQNGNTQALCAPFREELEQRGHTVSVRWLYDLEIRPCTACRACQRDWSGMHCRLQDDVPALAGEILEVGWASCGGSVSLFVLIYLYHCIV